MDGFYYTINDYNRNLQYRVKALEHELAAFKSGEIYTQMEARHKAEMAYSNRENEKLKREIAELNSRLVTVRNNWIGVVEDTEKEHTKELEKKDKEIQLAKNQAGRFLARYERERGKKREVLNELYALKTELDEARDRVNKLESIRKKDSTTSDKPPSTNSPFTNAKATSSREKSGNERGGQPGHEGHYLDPKENPDIIIEKKPPTHCPHCKSEVIIDDNYEAKQVIDIEIKVVTTEERVFQGICPDCGQVVCGEFSEGFNSPVCYGPSLKTIVSTLNVDSNVTVNKIVNFISSLTDNQINMSHGTVINFLKDLSGKLKSSTNDIADALASCKVLNADETGFKINGKLNWMQIIVNENLSLFARNPKRGTINDAMDKLLTLFVGDLMHDHFTPYYKYQHLTHDECNAHGGRYLKAVTEIMKHPWAKAMGDLLVETNNHKKNLIADNIHFLNEEQLDDIRNKYLAILKVYPLSKHNSQKHSESC